MITKQSSLFVSKRRQTLTYAVRHTSLFWFAIYCFDSAFVGKAKVKCKQ